MAAKACRGRRRKIVLSYLQLKDIFPSTPANGLGGFVAAL
jgi:hypothetical protein